MEAVLRSIPTSHVSTAEPIQLPPPFSLVRLRESGDAFAHACRIAPERGAGTLLGWPASADEDEPPAGAGQLTESTDLAKALAAPSWLDPDLGGPGS